LEGDSEYVKEKIFLGVVLEGWVQRSILLVVSGSTIQFQDPKTRKTLEIWPVHQIKAWGTHPYQSVLILDFGDFAKSKISIETSHPQQIAQLIGGIINSLVKRLQKEKKKPSGTIPGVMSKENLM